MGGTNWFPLTTKQFSNDESQTRCLFLKVLEVRVEQQQQEGGKAN